MRVFFTGFPESAAILRFKKKNMRSHFPAVLMQKYINFGLVVWPLTQSVIQPASEPVTKSPEYIVNFSPIKTIFKYLFHKIVLLIVYLGLPIPPSWNSYSPLEPCCNHKPPGNLEKPKFVQAYSTWKYLSCEHVQCNRIINNL